MKKNNFKNAVLRMSGIMALAIGVAAFTACSDDDKEVTPPGGEYPEFKDMAAQTEAHAAGSTVTLRFYAPATWDLESRTNWLTVPADKQTGTAGDQTVAIQVTDANRGFEDQEGTLAYRVNGQTYEYKITRKAAELALTVNGEDADNARIVLTELNGGFRGFANVTANFNWIADYPDWILPDKLDERGLWRGSADDETSNTLFADINKIDSEGTEGVIRFYYANGNDIDESRYFEVPVSTIDLDDDYFYWYTELGEPIFTKDGFLMKDGNISEQSSYGAKVVSVDPGYKIMAVESYDEYGYTRFREADWVKIEKVETRAAINSDNYIISVDANSGDSRSADLFFFPAEVRIPNPIDDLYDWPDYNLLPEFEPYSAGEIAQLGGKSKIAFTSTSHVTGEIINLIETGEVTPGEYGTEDVYKIIYPSTTSGQAMTIYMPDVTFDSESPDMEGAYLTNILDYKFELGSGLNIDGVLAPSNSATHWMTNITLPSNDSGVTREVIFEMVDFNTNELHAVVYIEQPSN